ncbi:Uncharacterised protein [Mycobacteroides abscessus subsp. abscessus]|nr:Uncharacterised protein [Mycobacteroides abscessus subsp. abscessus]
MITDSGTTNQCRSIPKRSCQIRTETPTDAPSDTATVPTMTRAATTLPVTRSMMMKIRQSEAIPARMRSYLAPSCRSLLVAAVPPM